MTGTAGWSHRGEYITKRGLTPAMADEALADPNAVTFNPDYNTKSGISVRTVGYSRTADQILSVITVDEDGVTYGINAWPSNPKDLRHYREAQ